MADIKQNGEEEPTKNENREAQANPEEEIFETSAQHPKQVTVTDVELRNLQKELLDYKDKYLRLLADVENTRKRMQKERQELTKYAVENIIIDFLRPLDNLENALRFAQQMSDEVKNWAVGFQMILTQFKDVLANNGVVSFDSVGKLFDPNFHEAVEISEASDQPCGTVVEEYVRGYRMGERTIRPSRVKVAKAVPGSQKSQEQKECNQNKKEQNNK